MKDLKGNLASLAQQRKQSKSRRTGILDTIVEISEARVAAMPDVTPQGSSFQNPAVARRLGKSPMPTPVATGGHGGNEASELWNRLQKMLRDAPGKITPGPRSRDYATQVKLWNAYQAGNGPMAAKPGTSKHGDGRANDLNYHGNESVRAWALANAGKYGLAFPIYNPKLGHGRDESWHVELRK